MLTIIGTGRFLQTLFNLKVEGMAEDDDVKPEPTRLEAKKAAEAGTVPDRLGVSHEQLLTALRLWLHR